MFHHHAAFDQVSRAMRAPQVPVVRVEVTAVPELIEALDRLFASRAVAPIGRN